MENLLEIKSKRQLKEKYFLKQDGSFVLKIYNDDIHYLKNGIYEEIDNTIMENKNYFYNKSNSFKALFNKKQNKILRLEQDNNYINFYLKNTKKINLKKENNKLKYTNIIDDINIEYVLTNKKVKESIILNNKNNIPEQLSFIIKTNLNLDISSNKIFCFKDKILFEIEPPYMFDSNNNYNYNIHYELKSKKNYYELNLLLDKKWLENAVFPVIIDPTITSNNEINDTYVNNGNINIEQDKLKIGVERINNIDVINRALIKFELPDIEPSSQILHASLSLYGYPINDEYIGELINVHALNCEWNKNTVNYQEMINKFDNKIEATSTSIRPIINNNTVTLNKTYFDLTNLVRKWYAGKENYGILLKANDEIYKENNAIFYSSNHGINDINPKPVLTINYRNQSGLESYMNYISNSFSKGSSYINTYNGNLTTIFDIGNTLNNILPINLKIIYNTNEAVLNNNYGYGIGYKLNLYQTIKPVVIDDISYLEYFDSDGTIHYFSNSNDKYIDEDNLNLEATLVNNNYILKDKNNNIMIFEIENNIGYLKQIKDVSNNTLNIIYNSNKTISKITSIDEEINITYSDNQIVIQSNETIKLNYNNNLTSINYLNGEITFTYSNNILTSIKDINNKKQVYDFYNKSYRVKKITEYGLNNKLGKFINISYGLDSTTLIDNKNRCKTVMFNSYGNPIQINDFSGFDEIDNAYNSNQSYGTPYYESNGSEITINNKYKNKLMNTDLSKKYINNYLTNTSFEEDNILFTSSNNTTLNIVNTEYVSGLRSLKVTNTSINEYIINSIKITKNLDYTFSAYLKNNNRIKISLSYYENDNLIEKISEIILPSNKFKRHDISINYSNNATSDLYIKIYLLDIGITYIDDIQLETGIICNKYNMIENSNFSKGLSDWTLTCYNENYELIENNNIFSVVQGINTNAIKVNMNPKNSTKFSKIYNMNGLGGDVYTVSFWFKNNGFIGVDGMAPGPRNNVQIFFYYNDTSNGHCVYLGTSFNSSDDIWQYYEATFVAEKEYSKFELRFNQSDNANEFYVTNICLSKNHYNFSYNYDDFGNLIYKTNLDNLKTNFNYDKNNELIKITNPIGKNFSFEYDNTITDRIISGISSTGISNEIIYDDFNNPLITKISKKYDELTNSYYKIRLKGTNKYLKSINDSLFFDSDNCVQTIWYLEKINDYYKIKHSIINKYINNFKLDNESTLFTLIKNNNGSYLLKVKDTDNYLRVNNDTLEIATLITNDYRYEFYFELPNSLFIENSATYKNNKFISSVTDTTLNTTLYDIDDNGLVKSVTNPLGYITNYNYNDKRQLASIINGSKIINYNYSNNELTKIYNDFIEYNFVYDDFFNIKSIKVGNNPLITNTYEENNGNLISSLYGNGNYVNFTYNEFDKLKKVTKMDDTFEYVYDSNLILSKVISNNDVYKYNYSNSKKLEEYSFNDFNIKYEYNNDNIIKKVYELDNSYTINNTYNIDDNITKCSFANNEFNYVYDELGRLINTNINNNYNTNYEYVTNGNRTSLLLKSISNNNELISYKYDKLNNITHIYNNGLLANKYYYNEYNELIKEENYISNELIKYKYDNNGNILYKKVFNLRNNSFIKQNKYEYDNIWKDKLVKFNDDVITYDEIGNPTSIGNKTLTWINGRQLKSYNGITYKYNKDSIRVSKIVDNVETKYYVEDDNIVIEKTNNDVIYYIRSNDDLIGLSYNGVIYYYIKNNQNDIIGLLDSNYNVVARYEYDALGNIIAITDGVNDVSNNINHIANINHYRYRSYYYDSESNLYYLNSRYYNPVWGRFLNADGVINGNNDILGYNLFAYCSNNFVNYLDK